MTVNTVPVDLSMKHESEWRAIRAIRHARRRRHVVAPAPVREPDRFFEGVPGAGKFVAAPADAGDGEVAEIGAELEFGEGLAELADSADMNRRGKAGAVGAVFRNG